MDNSKDYIVAQINQIEAKISKTKEMLKSKDWDIIKMAQDDILKLEKQKMEFLQNSAGRSIKGESRTSPKDCIMEIRAGTGGNEAGIFANNLYEMYSKFAEDSGWGVSELSKNEGGIGNIKEVIFEVKSLEYPFPYQLFRHESGVHRVQRVPITEAGGRIHTSTATVAVLPIVSDIELNIKPEDLRIDVFRAGGAGGQHVNKTESAVRITHIPTGTVAQCQDERSQHKNRERAISILKARIYAKMKIKQKGNIDGLRSSQVGTAERSEKIRTYNFPQNRITDHRIKKSWHNINEIMSGRIEKMLRQVNEGLQKGG